MTLEIKHLTHWYTDRDHKLYEDVNLTFESGRFTRLLVNLVQLRQRYYHF